jgi:MYXO-CTERM domain-containing protein
LFDYWEFRVGSGTMRYAGLGHGSKEPKMTALLSLVASPAFACGGMFCDPGPLEAQVVQNAERIAFAIDEDAGTVEAHVQIFYEGPPDDFAWVVPVQGNPEVFLSNDALFDRLATELAPVVRLDFQTVGNCRGQGGGLGCSSETALRGGPVADFDDVAPEDPVQVVNEGSVGPYDFVVLQADTTTALVEWLEDAAFAIPSTTDALLQPYLTPDAHFLAVRLSKDADTGDIAPLGWSYTGDAASVPIQLTAIATAPDLRLEVSVFGEHRAVPESYLHVRINEAQLNWFDGGSNYYDVVSRAADQAGGHAFATDFSGSTDRLRDTLWSRDRDQTAQILATTTDPNTFAGLLANLNLPDNTGLRVAFDNHGVVLPEALSAGLQLSASDLEDVDLASLAADLELYVFEPLRRAEALFDRPWVTRLSSSLDAAEMTIDPTFVLNPDVEQEVSNLHEATLYTECNGKRFDRAPRRLELADGRSYRLLTTRELQDQGTSDSLYWGERESDVEAIAIEQTGRSGPAELIADLSGDAFDQADAIAGGCGCTPGQAPFGPMGGLLFTGLGALLLRRRADA